ncbi:MAG: glycosyltransferase [Clostridia bacterium]|nr:glycosyltransferase [Clostridia bacterium]
MKVSIYALHLGYGGVENYAITLANTLSSFCRVEIVSTYKVLPHPAFPINDNVKIKYLINSYPHKKEFFALIKKGKLLTAALCAVEHILLFFEKYIKNVISVKDCSSEVIVSTRIFHNRIIGKYAGKDIYKITGEHNHHQNNKRYIRRVISSCRNFDAFIPISKELCDFYEGPLKRLGISTIHIPFCVERQDLTAIKDKFSIIYAGRLSKEKGIFDMIDVFELVHQKNNEAVLHVIGDGDEKERLINYIKNKKLQNCIILHGYKDKSYILDMMKKCSVYIMTSFTESFGISLLEAMSCGLPCVAFSDAKGALEIIENGSNGYVIDNRNKSVMAKKICELTKSPHIYEKLSNNAIFTADRYSPELMAAGWKNVIDTASSQKKPCASKSFKELKKEAVTD